MRKFEIVFQVVMQSLSALLLTSEMQSQQFSSAVHCILTLKYVGHTTTLWDKPATMCWMPRLTRPTARLVTQWQPQTIILHCELTMLVCVCVCLCDFSESDWSSQEFLWKSSVPEDGFLFCSQPIRCNSKYIVVGGVTHTHSHTHRQTVWYIMWSAQ